MKIRIIAPGKIKEKWLKDGIAEYIKRLSGYAEVEITEVPDSPDSIPEAEGIRREGEQILSKISDKDIVWVMDLHGKEVTSEELSEYLINDIERGGAKITIVIGGSCGISDEVRKRSQRKIKFGDITLTHQMTRLILMEQLYRAFKIARGEKYHK
ncbi:MAG: 23S rRNA (pseudouridine(1915)-N(3))-methyltransferase RlmH [Clostridiales bacterium]|nr:23S rRNA (pseudouridine(1915)-N(3))-methyltransferase RlmH [Clostridiales bacterium]